jgi:hypothetical protein
MVSGKYYLVRITVTANVSVGRGLQQLSAETLAKGLQVSTANPMVGVSSRAAVLNALGSSLLEHPQVFGHAGRPGNLVGESFFLLAPSMTGNTFRFHHEN